jgi:hypothetical protein
VYTIIVVVPVVPVVPVVVVRIVDVSSLMRANLVAEKFVADVLK